MSTNKFITIRFSANDGLRPVFIILPEPQQLSCYKIRKGKSKMTTHLKFHLGVMKLVFLEGI